MEQYSPPMAVKFIWKLGSVNPTDLGKKDQTQIWSLKVGFKRSALDMGKIEMFIVQEKGASRWRVWQANS